ncbi:MAG: LacI family transcriptional regulator [Thiothrix sp.]|nr:MAG: LacI family transcriptional regulator [Thiothrix sp.]
MNRVASTAITQAATSQDVAKLAGVSRTTVSFVLNNRQGMAISEATRQRVLEAAASLGYTPNAAAQKLARGSTETIGLVIPKLSHLYVDVFLAQLVASVNEQCHRYGLKLLIESNEDEGCAPGGFVNLVKGRHIDGLIVCNLRLEEYPYLQALAEANIPLVTFGHGQPELEAFCTMGNNTYEASVLLMQHLVGLGHKDIAHIGFASNEYLAVNDRYQAWREYTTQAGCQQVDDLFAYGDLSAQSGYEAMQTILKRDLSFTALFAGNDTLAFGAMRALREAGLRIPEDVAVVGYDDIPLAAYATPPLTTVRSDPVRHGVLAMQLLMEQLNADEHNHPAPKQYSEPVELIVRESCGVRLRS